MADLGLTSKQIKLYFMIDQWIKKWNFLIGLFAVAGVIGYFSESAELLWSSVVLGVLCVVRVVMMQSKCPSDEQIDAAWNLAAESRYEEALRVSHIDEEELAGEEGRGIDHFFGWPAELQPEEQMPYRSKIGKDGIYRSNYEQLVFVLYGRLQLMSFDEPFCIENQWDGRDQTKEYYWKDIGGIEFDQRDQEFRINAQGMQAVWPLAGSDGQEGGYFTERAESISTTCRAILRQKKMD